MEDSDEVANINYFINHIFLPPRLPHADDLEMKKEHALCCLIQQIAETYQKYLPFKERLRWDPIIRMLKNLANSQEFNEIPARHISQCMKEMKRGDVLAFPIRAQNAGIILRKMDNKTVFESFEMSPPNEVVMACKGKLLCSYPGPAIAVPSNEVDDPTFRREFASFLAQMNVDLLDAAATTTKAGSTVVEERDTANPRYITELLTGILRGLGHVEDVKRIQKRIADEVLWEDAFKPWRRSPVWLLIRVSIQTTLHQTSEMSGYDDYKVFMVYLMARIVRMAVVNEFGSELLFCMRAKMSRRLYKLRSVAPTFVFPKVCEIAKEVEELLQGRWSAVERKQAQSPHWAPEQLDFMSDTKISLAKSSSYILKTLRGDQSHTPSNAFLPKHIRRHRSFQSFCDCDLSKAFSIEPLISLADFEQQVQDDIDQWVKTNLHVSTSATRLASCITQYSRAAIDIYASNPDNQSIMLLTLFELWVALDKIALAQCPLLSEYSPEVPRDLLEPLLLRRRRSIERFARIQAYIHSRHNKSRHGNSVFVDVVNNDSFAVRFFDASLKHQTLKTQIEREATSKRKEKGLELSSQNDLHRNLMNQSRILDHEYRMNNRGHTQHFRKCHKCVLENRAKNLRITPHEWPLPVDTLKAKATVFELQCPPVFATWRDITYQVLHDICTPSDLHRPVGVEPPIRLDTYTALQEYRNNIPGSRVMFASTTKSYLQAHYRTSRIPCSESSINVNNGLTLKLYDASGHAWAVNAFQSCSIDSYCTPKLPRTSSYNVLQYAVEATTHIPNRVLADQSECPQDLSLHEYIAFGNLRSGHHLQWLNIARELSSRSLSFHKSEVHTLMVQAAWQIGHLSQDGESIWHSELTYSDFGLVLLEQLEGLLLSIDSNWLEVISARTIIMLASRLLVSANDKYVIDKAYSVMRKARGITFRWVRQLSQKLQASEGDSQIREFQSKVLEVAATCRGTYDVDHIHLLRLLECSEDISVLIECSVLIHDNSLSSVAELGDEQKRLLNRDMRLSYCLEQRLCQQIGQHREGLDKALSAMWPAYRPGSDWQQLSSPNERWFVTQTFAQAGFVSQNVHYNILEGLLLIGGKSLGRLPKALVEHSTYIRILGSKVLDVIPANIPGVHYATRGRVSEYQVFFALRESDNELMIRTKMREETLELLPHKCLSGDLPTIFVDNYTHWLNLDTGEIELRPLESLWRSSRDNWRIRFSGNGQSIMRRNSGVSSLVDIKSDTFRMVSALFRPLEYEEYITVIYSTNNQHLSVDLPRFRLTFFINNAKLLECQNLPGMVIDSCQSTGSMLGLSNQLVLCSTWGVAHELPRSRCVLIPQGKVDYKKEGDHVSITIDTRGQHDVKYHNYTIDLDLDRLVGNTSLTSRLYKVYLHALSSHCLPDPLTERTGIEEAMDELRSASCRSFQKLGEDETNLLRLIGSLTPNRGFYPPDKMVMERISWSGRLPTLTQHYAFYSATKDIIEYAERLQAFNHQTDIDLKVRPTGFEHLLERTGNRAMLFYISELRGSSSFQITDSIHTCATMDAFHAEAEVYTTSTMIVDWPSRLNTATNLFETLESWGRLQVQASDLSLSYSRHWLSQKLEDTWISLYNLSRESSRVRSRFSLLFSLSAMAYSSDIHRSLASTLLAFSTIPDFRTLNPPPWDSYDLQRGFKPDSDELRELIHSSAIKFEASPESSLPALNGESAITLAQRRYNAFEIQVNSQADQFLARLMSQWPCENPITPSNQHSWHFNVKRVMLPIRACFANWFRNRQFHDHLRQVQGVLGRHREVEPNQSEEIVGIYSYVAGLNSRATVSSTVRLDELLRRDAPLMKSDPINLEPLESTKESDQPETSEELQSLLSEFRRRQDNPFHQLYGDDLETSQKALRNSPLTITSTHLPYTINELKCYQRQCSQHVIEMLASIQDSLLPSTPAEISLLAAGLWPRTTTRSLLGLLAFESRLILNDEWKSVLISFAQGIILLQRSQRLLSLALHQNYEDFARELENSGRSIFTEIHHLDWLLIQVDNNFLLRPTQNAVAREMIAPQSTQNIVLQLNMGEGKSSVLVPLAAAALANGHNLCRIIVLKSLSSQMFQLLVERLSGLTNRRIFYMPFSRTVTIQDNRQMQQIHSLYEDCMRMGGVLVVQPEHVLSFKLMGIDRILSSNSSEDHIIANGLLETQQFLNERSRDILDESDEILHVRYQLIYTMGQQRPVEDHPDRWLTIQQIFTLVKKYAHIIQRQFPLGIEVQATRHGGFPVLRILQENASEALVSSIATDALNGGVLNFSFSLSSTSIRRAALRMITRYVVSSEDVLLVQDYCKFSASWKGLLLLRGLLVKGILQYVLKERRWRVDYGLDLTRSLLAVPYRAKDVPALRAEFGHPDIAIALTCLSYYYGGLSDSQLETSFELLFKLDNPIMEYEKWIHGNDTIPEALRHLSGVNIKDPQQWNEQLAPLFRGNHAVTDFFLSQIVFPKEAKEFPEKLSTSGWDISQTKAKVTTGFSGTNDNKYLLPTSITQHDIDSLRGTNAKVLNYLLQQENQFYMTIQSQDGISSTKHCLHLLVTQTPEIRVLLDVGAQMLDLKNDELARFWLSMRPDIPAVIFFGDDDEMVVLTKDGLTEAFISSPYKHQLDKCLVYLDDAHTRGTDLKFPRKTRAAVTLGLKVTKDRLTQGCMRMRKLGQGQSVLFLAPPEVDRSIRKAAQKTSDDNVRVVDILRWAMLETCAEIQHYVPYWAQQGVDYERRKIAQDEFLSSDKPDTRKLAASWLQPESRTLEDMYGPSTTSQGSDAMATVNQAAIDLVNIRARCEMLGVPPLLDTGMGEEQEREVSHEIERERQVERPPKSSPAKHTLHPHVKEFVKTSRIPTRSKGFIPVFRALCDGPNQQEWPPDLLASKDFFNTIQNQNLTGSANQYLRPVHWILSSESGDGRRVLVLLSPYEVNEMFLDIRNSKTTHLHQYSPRVTQAMRSFDDLKFYCIPPLPLLPSWTQPPALLTIQLNLCAGQLYLPNYATYVLLCEFLGIYHKVTGPSDVEDTNETLVQHDGFISPSARSGPMKNICSFNESPLPFLKELFGLRRKGMGYLATHMGRILHGRSLTEEDFQ